MESLDLTAMDFDKFRAKLNKDGTGVSIIGDGREMNIQEIYTIDKQRKSREKQGNKVFVERILKSTASSQDSAFGGTSEDIKKRMSLSKIQTKKGVYTTLGHKSIYKKPKLKVPTLVETDLF